MIELTIQLQDQPYIELNKLLKLMDVVDSGGMANMLILDGEVSVNNMPVHEKRKKVRPGDVVQVGNHRILVQTQE
ncbi:MAG: RNA-binding S4 domain-containing protein [Saprospiraceae bacterium]|nr:RNA-binding S4 domain-containing protein [Saprospiraceae bacterium]